MAMPAPMPTLPDTLISMLSNASLMINAQAAILNLAPCRAAPEGLVIGYAMARPDAQQVASWLREQIDLHVTGDMGTFSVPAEYWPASVARAGGPNDGLAFAIALVDPAGSMGWMIFFGLPELMMQPSLALPRMRQAFLGQLAAQLRAILDLRSLAIERDQLAAVYQFSGDGILTVDGELRITGCNPAFERLVSSPKEAMLGRFYIDVLRPEDHAGESLGLGRCPLMETFATGQPVVGREIVLHARDGQRLDVEVTAAAVLSPSGKPISGVLNVRDVERSRENEQLSSTIISVVSHELQTPISIIKGYASTLSRPEANWNGEALYDRLHAIEEEADRLSHMVGNLLYASRIQAGGLSMQTMPLDVGEVVASCVRRVRGQDSRHPILLQLPDNSPIVDADVTRLEEVIMNLIDNAKKYSPAGSPIAVGVHSSVEEVFVSVADQGAGIPLREQPRVFERFRRVDGTLTRQTSGAGLGLFICQAIVRAHGGKIWVESELGHGSVFSFSLPRAEQAQLPMVELGDG